MATGMSAHVAGTVGPRDSRHLRVVTGPGVVDQICPRLTGGIGDGGPPGVDTDHQIRKGRTDRRDERHDPAKLFAGADLRPGTCLDPANVDRIGAVRHGARHRCQGEVVVEVAAGVVEGVGCAVDDCQQARLPW